MNLNPRPKLTLDRPDAYQIEVPGHIDESWAEWTDRLDVKEDQ